MVLDWDKTDDSRADLHDFLGKLHWSRKQSLLGCDHDAEVRIYDCKLFAGIDCMCATSFSNPKSHARRMLTVLRHIRGGGRPFGWVTRSTLSAVKADNH